MHYYAHKGAGHVVSLLDGETLEGQGHNPEDYAAVHLHKNWPSGPGKVFAVIVSTALILSILSFALGLAVLGVRFAIGAFA